MTDAPDDAVDWQHLAGFSGGDRGLEAEFLAIFMANAPDYLVAMKATTGATADDWRSTAHKLKGAARAIGARRLAALAEKAEVAAVASDPLMRDDLLARLDAEFRAVAAAISGRPG